VFQIFTVPVGAVGDLTTLTLAVFQYLSIF